MIYPDKYLTLALFLFILLLCSNHVYADHLKGGWIKYTYTGESGNNAQYHITFYQYSDCSEPEKVDDDVYLSVHDVGTLQELIKRDIALTKVTSETKSDFGPCLNDPPKVCYLVAEYNTDISVPKNSSGYIITFQRCCRIKGIVNLYYSHNVGITYTVTIPGGSSENDNSPVFGFNDMIAICYNSPFSFDFSATDIDGDSLSYTICSGLSGGTAASPLVFDPPPPPYTPVPYVTPYTGFQPLGPLVTIDSKTGIISGRSPNQVGTYVVAVCVAEFRNGIHIADTRKELHIDVNECSLVASELNPSYITCDSYNFTFSNNYRDNSNMIYHWDFGIAKSNDDTSNFVHPTYTYPDTGLYNVTLNVRNTAGCQDSAKTQVKIYPGFKADFSYTGNCTSQEYNFKDLTTAKYGTVNSWVWNLGDTYVLDSTQNPRHTYTVPLLYPVQLISTSTKGCTDTVTKNVEVLAGPQLGLQFKDTLICTTDTLKLNAFSPNTGVTFSWSPVHNIINSNSAFPLVYPQTTTLYDVTATDSKGCPAKDTVTVNVVDHVALSLPGDTTICQTDSIQLKPSTNALYFSWSPSAGLSNAKSMNPKAAPLTNTTYNLTASIGKCFAKAARAIKVVPYPYANAGSDAVICYGKTTQLNASITGSGFSWAPVNSMVNPSSLSPIVGPTATITYTLKVTDTIGCPKSSYDSVLVKVVPKVIAFAGNDTIVVRSQPVQLNATGGTDYLWTPSTYLSDPTVANPLAVFTGLPDTITYHVKVSTPEGCFNIDSIKIYIFETKPEVFIPTAFTPNGDGLNDVFKPIVAGMKQFQYLNVYNRWGQLLFKTATPDKGWDGNFNGTSQPGGTYIYVIQTIDYNNNPYFKKGTFVLIR